MTFDILRLIGTQADDVDAEDAALFVATGEARSLRIVADVPIHVEIGVDAVATDESCYVNEFKELYVSVGADEDVSILGTDGGKVWVSEVRASS